MRRVAACLMLVFVSCSTGTGIDADFSSSTTSTSAATTTSTSIAPTTTAVRPEVCDSIAEEPLPTGTITDDALVEISGIARSEVDGSRLWAHNDSGAPPRLWSVDRDGTVLGYVEVRARNVDWEDIALGPGPDGASWVYLADIGDNLNRRNQVWLHRFAEPTEVGGVVDIVESLAVTYPDGPSDAEALLVDPITGDAFVITKTASGRSSVYRIPVGAWSQDGAEAELVATVDLGALAFVTAADVSPDGRIIALRTYGDVWLWERLPGQTIVEAIRGRPCRSPAPSEPQGEAIAVDATGYTTVSEGSDPVVYRFGDFDD